MSYLNKLINIINEESSDNKIDKVKTGKKFTGKAYTFDGMGTRKFDYSVSDKEVAMDEFSAYGMDQEEDPPKIETIKISFKNPLVLNLSVMDWHDEVRGYFAMQKEKKHDGIIVNTSDGVSYYIR